MQIKLLELTTKEELLPLYDVYKDCTYLPNEEKYREKVKFWFQDDSIKVFACVNESDRKGLLVLKFSSKELEVSCFGKYCCVFPVSY